MSDLHPTSCKEPVNPGGVYICRLGCSPCNLYLGKTCEKLKISSFNLDFEGFIKEQMNSEGT